MSSNSTGLLHQIALSDWTDIPARADVPSVAHLSARGTSGRNNVVQRYEQAESGNGKRFVLIYEMPSNVEEISLVLPSGNTIEIPKEYNSEETTIRG